MPTFFFIIAVMPMYRDALFRSVAEVVEPLLQRQGFELVELRLQQCRGRWLVRIYVDVEGGISLEDCRRLSFEIGHLFDAEDRIPVSYVLEVSSPGLDRPLRTTRDFERQCQRLVTVFLRSPLQGKQQYTGRIAMVTPMQLVLHNPPHPPLEIPLSQIEHGIVELEFK